MKRFLLLFTLFAAMAARGQFTFYNEWIDHSKTYYKFKIVNDGLYRLNQSSLPAAINTANAEHFQLWRNGKQVAIYTSRQTGAFQSGDYIEFWGLMNDGKMDKDMYRDPSHQLNDRWNLISDTAYYFLTINPAGGNLRLQPQVNDISSPLPVETYFMHTVGKYWKNRIGQGFAQVVGESVFSSAYDEGEGWTSNDISFNSELSEVFSNLQVYTGPGGPAQSTLRIHASGYNGLNQRVFRVTVNGDSIIGQPMDFYYSAKVTKNFPTSLIQTNSANVTIRNQCLSTPDRMLAHLAEIIYPRTFNFNNQANFTFVLPANATGNYLEITNFNYGSQAPVLYDLTNNRRYVGNISAPGTVKVQLLPSATERTLILVSQEASNITTVTSFTQKNFINFSTAANQGDYLIITNPSLLNGQGGSTPVLDYKNYRSSAAGGSYNTNIYLIDELYDQFAYGVRKHPISIRNFIRWARTNFSSPIKYVLIIGKGVQYIQYRSNQNHADLEKLHLVPTFGHPASDMLLSAEPGLDQIPLTPIGRISAITPEEVTIYLDKLKQYEAAQAFQSPLIADKAWMKDVGHVVGASEGGLQVTLQNFMNKYKRIVSDTFYGGNVHTFSKTSTEAVEQAANVRLQNMFQNGHGLLTYFGHSSASTLEYNLDNPQNYNNLGKYPLFVLLGCNAGNFFNYNLARLNTKETISERYVLAPNRGSIASVASTHLGIVHYLDIYSERFYETLSNYEYGQSIGKVLIETQRRVFSSVLGGQNDYYARMHCEQATLHGDPALKLNTFPKPDYVIEDNLVKIDPQFVSVGENSFRVDATFMNIGKAISKNIVIELKRTFPNNPVPQVIQRDTIPGTRYIDSISYVIPIVATRDKGLNKITITIEADNVVDELYETNNSITKDVFIFEDEARPVAPYNYSIVNRQNIRYVVSTANPFSASRQYTMQIDTTEKFNSPLLVTTSTTSAGGVFEFNPTLTFLDSTVYYWRVAPDVVTGTPSWNVSSFIYLPNHDLGFNQSHYYQHDKSQRDRILLDANDRTWRFDSIPHFLFAKNGVFGTASGQEGDFIVAPDGDPYIRSACVGNSLIFNIFEPLKFRPETNPNNRYGSGNFCAPSRLWNFEFSYMTPASRKLAMDFMDSIPDGHIVVVRNILNDGQVTGYVNEWKDDTTIHGSGKSLFHKLYNLGFTVIDSFSSPRAFILVYQKDRPGFQIAQTVSLGKFDLVTIDKSLRSPDTLGYITSPLFGRAAAWKDLSWRGATDVLPGDAPLIDVIGVDNAGNETVVVPNLDMTQQDWNISFVDAAVYPFVKLRMRNLDTAHYTPYQLRYWRLTYDPVPEGAIAPNLFFSTRDTVEVGEPFDFKVAFKNVSELPFDSMRTRIVITDRNNLTHIVPLGRRRPLQASPDTIHVGGTIQTHNLPGRNTLYIEVNPDNDQPEQHHFNNFAYREFYVKPDSLNPLMDVTFDGVHILNRDIVSAKPEILIKLRDESKWMVLDDTSLITIQVRYPDGSLHRYYFSQDTLQFLPAGQAPNTDNTASIFFRPHFLQDGQYELLVSGRDRSNNAAGRIEYRVSFQVFNKPMISNMLNYPNPFTTSTAFVFTITGSQVPQNLRIQILTITGKVVREITKDELGPLKVGRNITDFKWDGTDQYGQKLANGIYLYRVITNLNGKSLDKFKGDGDNTDKYFNNGYGKMYLMR